MAITISVGDVEYIATTETGGGLPSSGQLEIPSDSILSAELTIDANVKRHFNIASQTATDTTHHNRDYTLNLQYELQQVEAATHHQIATCLEAYAITRASYDLSSLAFVVDYLHGATSLLLKGAKVNTLSYACSINDAILMSAEIWGTGIETGTANADFTNYSSLDASVAVANQIEIYGGAAITRSGMYAAGVKSGTFTINNNLERIPKVGSQDATGIKPGDIEWSFAGEALSDGGSKTDFDDLIAAGETDIVFDTGTTASASQKITLTNPTYNRQSQVLRQGDKHLVLGVDLGAESGAMAAYS